MWYHWNIFVRTMNSTASDAACVETIWREPMTLEMIEMTLQNSLDIFRSHGVMETCCWPENSIEEGSLSPSNSPVSLGISACPDAQQAASCQKPSSSFRHAVPKIIKSPRGRYFNSNLRAILLPIRIIVWTCMDWINHADVFLPRFGAVHYSLLLRQFWEARLSPHVFFKSTSPTFVDELWRGFVPSFPFHAPHLMDCFEVREAPIRKASGGENWMKLLPASCLQQGLCYEHIWTCYILKFKCIHWMWRKFDKMWITYSQLWVTLAIACDTIPILALRWNLGRWFGCFPRSCFGIEVGQAGWDSVRWWKWEWLDVFSSSP